MIDGNHESHAALPRHHCVPVILLRTALTVLLLALLVAVARTIVRLTYVTPPVAQILSLISTILLIVVVAILLSIDPFVLMDVGQLPLSRALANALFVIAAILGLSASIVELAVAAQFFDSTAIALYIVADALFLGAVCASACAPVAYHYGASLRRARAFQIVAHVLATIGVAFLMAASLLLLSSEIAIAAQPGTPPQPAMSAVAAAILDLIASSLAVVVLLLYLTIAFLAVAWAYEAPAVVIEPRDEHEHALEKVHAHSERDAA